MRPILPKDITNKLPIDIIKHIYSYVPHNEKEKEKIISHSCRKDLHCSHLVTPNKLNKLNSVFGRRGVKSGLKEVLKWGRVVKFGREWEMGWGRMGLE